ncbi:MAG: ribosomal protein S18-alanine N-acetyltransferase [Pacificimonas sp.]
MTPTFRRAGVDDAETLERFSKEAFDPRFGESWSRGQLVGTLSLATSWSEIVEIDESIAGFAVLRHVVDESELLLIAVRADLRGSGLGRDLLARASNVAAERGSRQLFLEVRASNVAGRKLYERLGFAKIGERKGYYRGRGGEMHDAITMARDLL